MKRNNFFIISALLIVCLFLGLASVSAASSDIYVSPNGNDTSNNGTVDSPYQSIGKAVNQSSNSSNVNIYLEEGTYRGKGNNTEIEINKAHISQGGSISIIGKGKDKTFIDGGTVEYFLDIKADSIVYLYNLTIRNCKSTNGGAILNYGNLSITNCNFENNYATSYGGAIYSEYGANLNVVNSVFNNSYAASYGGVIFGYIVKLNNCNFTNNIVDSNIIYSSDANSFVYNCYFINNTINSTSSWIYSTLYMNGGSIVNNTFINCSAPNSDSTPILYIGGTIYLKNNTVINCFNKNNLSFIKSEWANFNSNLTFLGNSTVNVNRPTNIRLTALLTDDMGNPINGGTVYFIINGILNKSNSTNASGIATYTFTKLFDDGLYVVSGYVGSENLTSVRTAIINVSIDRSPVTYYVSNSGDDDTGDGSQDNPFKTIKKAINQGFAVSIYPTIMIMEGTYTGVGNTNLSFSDLGILNIIGVYNKTIIDGESSNWGFRFGDYIQSNIVNMTFNNCNSSDYNYYSAIYAFGVTNIINCIFENNNGPYSLLDLYYGSKIINSTFINNNATSTYNLVSISNGLIENCLFINNSAPRAIVSGSNNYVKNCSFINNTLTDDYANSILYGSGTSINNNFIKNFAPSNGAVLGSFNSFNDTFIGNKGVNGAITASSATFTNATFINNSASGNGSIVYIPDNNVVDFINCTFDGNYANGT